MQQITVYDKDDSMSSWKFYVNSRQTASSLKLKISLRVDKPAECLSLSYKLPNGNLVLLIYIL